MDDTRKCVNCGGDYDVKSSNQQLCSDECRKSYYGQERNGMLPSGTTGAVSELMVSSTLMQQGWSVFRSLSPCCFCDLIAIKEGKVKMLEVRTGIKSVTGKISYPPAAHAQATEIAVWVRNTQELMFFPVTCIKSPSKYMKEQMEQKLNS